MISPDSLERYADFIDPEHTRVAYDPRQGLERLLGVLSPDPKGIVVAAMGNDWYSKRGQLHTAITQWLEELNLPHTVWPISNTGDWQYCERRNKLGEIIDGSLVNLGAIVKKAEDPSQTLYSRSVAGAELAVPLIQQAVLFVSRATEYVEAKKLQGSIPHRFESMCRIIGGVQSRWEQRRTLAVFDTANFLVNNPGNHRPIDITDELHSTQNV